MSGSLRNIPFRCKAASATNRALVVLPRLHIQRRPRARHAAPAAQDNTCGVQMQRAEVGFHNTTGARQRNAVVSHSNWLEMA